MCVLKAHRWGWLAQGGDLDREDHMDFEETQDCPDLWEIWDQLVAQAP